MEMLRRVAWVLVFTICFSLLILPMAGAYVDPGTGSYIFQLLIGVMLGALVAVKVFWRRIWGFVTRGRSRSDAAHQGPSPSGKHETPAPVGPGSIDGTASAERGRRAEASD